MVENKITGKTISISKGITIIYGGPYAGIPLPLEGSNCALALFPANKNNSTNARKIDVFLIFLVFILIFYLIIFLNIVLF